MCVVFSPDGRRIATSSIDLTIKLWDSTTGQEVLTLRGHTSIVYCLAFSPDGRRLASGSGDWTVRIWDATPLSADALCDQEARVVVRSLIREHPLHDEVLERLRSDRALSEPVRAAALGLAEQWPGDPDRLEMASWNVVMFPNGNHDDYLLASRWAEEAMRLNPEYYDIVNTMGVALYRVGRYQEALETLHRSEQLRARTPFGRRPSAIAFLAMAHHQLGHRDEARAYLEKTRAMMKTDPWANNVELRMFLREAEELIKPKTVGTTTESRPARQDESP
jgi:hypothetical protein